MPVYFIRVDDFFTRASDHNSPLRSELRGDKLVLFLHLLGLDSNGHVNKPHSEAYRANLALVDAGARRVAQLVDSHWRSDDRTAFVFTADHGMTDWGSHGTGNTII